MNTERIFRYYPDNFGDLTVKVIHMDLVFDVHDDHTRVSSTLHVKTLDTPLSELALNAKNLEILSVTCNDYKIVYNYKKAESLLSIIFEKPVPLQTDLFINTETICRPTKNLLEGLYYDETPRGAPPQQITQCQQWGFQRLVPCIDDMAAKCTYTTKIIADERYTNLITNGDVVETRHSAGDGRVSLTYSNEITPMATYLFFLGVGTYETFKRIFEYPDGKTFMLELLVPPETDQSIANQALEILADSIMWIHLFTGITCYQNMDIRNRIYYLVQERDKFIQSGNDKKAHEIRELLKELVLKIKTGYAYTGTVYREIGMQNSDFGGMENVGNTTITTNRIMPFSEATDVSYEYMIRVKVHEFYHNLNGSEVTGQSPFEIWLNEAVTVHIEDQYHAFLFGRDYSRLQTVLTLLSPSGGTFMYDRGAGSMPIEPDGFNDPNDLITGVTYVKSPEFVRMIETLMGKENFVKALDLYHRRYQHGNATGAQWLEAMEESCGLDFKTMAEQWLKLTGYPVVDVTTTYESQSNEFTINLRQSGPDEKSIWEFPFTAVLVDHEGNDIDEKLIRVKNREETITFSGVQKPAFVSLNRGYAFYGKVQFDESDNELFMQTRMDIDLINRYCAFYHLLDREKMRLLKNPYFKVSDRLVDLYYELLSDEKLMGEAGGQFLTVFESVDDERQTHRYRALYDVKQKIFRAIAERYRTELTELYHIYNSRITGKADLHDRINDIKICQVKNTCLNLISTLDTLKVHAIIRNQLDDAANGTDRLTAFACYLDSSAEDRYEVIKNYESQSKENPVSWEIYLSAVAGNSKDDAVEIIRQVEKSPAFRIEQANDQRALYGRFAQNKKLSLQSPEGRKFLSEVLLRLSGINEYSTVNILSVFGNIDKMEKEYHIPLVDMLISLKEKLDQKRTPGVYNTIRRLLIGAPVATAEYEEYSGQH